MKTADINSSARILDLSASMKLRESRSTVESDRAPTTPGLRLAYIFTLAIAVLMAGVSAAGLVLAPLGFYGDPKTAASIVPGTAGVLVPGFAAHDLLNLVLVVPILLALVWLAHRGSLVALLLWPGALFYVLYTFVTYVVGAPFGVLFVPHIALGVLAAYAVLVLVASIDHAEVRHQFGGHVPARAIGVVLVALALLTLGQDGFGAMATALSGSSNVPARHVWIADLAIEVPALLIGGLLLWRGNALGYTVGPGLLFQFGITPVVLAAIIALQPALTASPIDWRTIVGLLVFAAVAFAPIGFFVRAAVPKKVTK